MVPNIWIPDTKKSSIQVNLDLAGRYSDGYSVSVKLKGFSYQNRPGFSFVQDIVSGPLAIFRKLVPIFCESFMHHKSVFNTVDPTFVNVHSVDVKL